MSDEKTPPAEAGDKSGYHKDGGEWAPMGWQGLGRTAHEIATKHSAARSTETRMLARDPRRERAIPRRPCERHEECPRGRSRPRVFRGRRGSRRGAQANRRPSGERLRAIRRGKSGGEGHWD